MSGLICRHFKSSAGLVEYGMVCRQTGFDVGDEAEPRTDLVGNVMFALIAILVPQAHSFLTCSGFR